jgi:hypothetical protein
MKRTLFFAAFAAAALAAQSASALTVGSNNTGNCFPFSCLPSFNAAGVFQQVYNAANFAGPTAIAAINLFQSSPGQMDEATYSVAWYISNTAYLASSTTLSDNLGALLSDWGTVSIAGAMPTTLTIAGSTFTYDPTDGDLLLHVEVQSVTTTFDRGFFFFQADSGDSAIYRNFGGTGIRANFANALVTEFVTADVPLPAAAPLLLGGLALIVGVARRRAA